MAQKFLTDVELDAGLVDGSNSTGTSGYVLSSTGAATSWVDPGTLTAEAAEVVQVPVKNLQGSALTKGDPVYISGSVGASGRLEVKLADAGDDAKMPAVGLLAQDLAINGEGYAVVTGKLRNLITSPINGTTTSGGEVLYVKSGSTTGSALTTVKPTGVNFIQNVGKIGRASTSNDGTLVVSSILRSNDVPTPLYIDHDNQRVGIDEQTPAEKLVVSEIRTGSTPSDLYTTVVKSVQSAGATPNPGTGGLKVQYYDGANNHAFGLVAGTTSSDFLTSGPMHFYTNSDLDTVSATGLAMILDNSQNLGIGVTSITAGNRLEVAGGAVGVDDYIVHNGDTDTKFGFVANDNFAITTGGTERVRVTSGGSVGIVTNNPSAKLDVEGNAVLGSSGNTATGSYAVALNQNNTASSLDSLATGENTTASGRQSFSGGYNTTASGAGSFAIGGNSVASGANSLCAGGDGTTTGSTATSIGTLNDATGDYSFAAGYNSTASGLVSFAMGSGVTASGPKSTAFGQANNIAGELNFAIGISNSSNQYTYGNLISGNSNGTNGYSGAYQSSFNIGGGIQNNLGKSSYATSACIASLVVGSNNKVGYWDAGGSLLKANPAQGNIVGGDLNYVLGSNSIVVGQYNTMNQGQSQAIFGVGCVNPGGTTLGQVPNQSTPQLICGRNNAKFVNNSTGMHLFAVGNGGSDSSRFTTMNVYASATGTARVGIAQDVPAYVLDVTGQARFTGGYTTSDERLKENIQDNTLGLSELKQLRTVSYDWKSGKILGRSIEDIATNKNCRGLIAQEAEIVSPDLVDTDDSEYGIKSIDSGALTAMLIKSVQEQQDIIESLKERIQALENN